MDVERPTPERRRLDSGSQRVAVALITLASLLCFAQRNALIDRSLPYPRHVDEVHCSQVALRMLETGDYNPRQLDYPTLPIYLTAAAMVAGYFSAAAQPGAKIAKKQPADLGRVTYPYYTRPQVMKVPRLAFALLSSLGILLLGLAALRLTDSAWAALASVGLLAFSPTYLSFSWEYLNVDIVGAFFTTATLYAMLRYWDSECSLARAAALGALCGLSAGCKYTYGLVLVPVVVSHLLTRRDRFFILSGISLAAAAAAFLLVVPHVLLDTPTFVRDLGFQVYHYRVRGHRTGTAEPGLSHLLWNLRELTRDFGYTGLAAAFLGALALLRRSFAKGLVVLLIGAPLLWLLSQQRTHFVRNLIPLFPIVALLIAVGIHSAVRLVGQRIAKWWPGLNEEALGRTIAPGLVLAVVLAGLPWPRFARAHGSQPESRVQAARWIQRHVPEDATIVLAKSLQMAPSTLGDRPRPPDVFAAPMAGAARDSYLVLPGSTAEQPASVTGRAEILADFGHSTAMARGSQVPDPRLVIAHVR